MIGCALDRGFAMRGRLTRTALVVALGIAGIAAAAPAAAQQTEPGSRGGSTPGDQEISTGRQFALGARPSTTSAAQAELQVRITARRHDRRANRVRPRATSGGRRLGRAALPGAALLPSRCRGRRVAVQHTADVERGGGSYARPRHGRADPHRGETALQRPHGIRAPAASRRRRLGRAALAGAALLPHPGEARQVAVQLIGDVDRPPACNRIHGAGRRPPSTCADCAPTASSNAGA